MTKSSEVPPRWRIWRKVGGKWRWVAMVRGDTAEEAEAAYRRIVPGGASLRGLRVEAVGHGRR